MQRGVSLTPYVALARTELDSQMPKNESHPGLVSIVLPTYNGAKYLRRSIASCLGQTHTNLELLVVVDGSTDETDAVLLDCTDPRLKVVRHEMNRGLPEALNTGFAHSKGEYLTWTSDDNWYAPEAVEEMVRFLRNHPRVALVYTDLYLVDATGCVLERLRVLPADHLTSQPWNGIHACFLYRREVYETIGDYRPWARLAEDYDYWLRTAERFKIAPHHRALYYYRQHGGSLTGVRGRYAASRQILRIRRRRRWMSLRDYLRWSAYLDVDEAFWSWQQGNVQRTRCKGLSGLVKNPRNVRNLGLVSILTEAFLGPHLAGYSRRAGRSFLRRFSSTTD